MNCLSFFKTASVCLFILSGMVPVEKASAQTDILNGDGTPLITRWCHDDTMHRIIGQPAGGTFSGCGVINDNGNWYFNPEVAGQGQGQGFNCNLVYTPPGGGPTAERKIEVLTKYTVKAAEDLITCDGNFYLQSDVGTVSSQTWTWSPGQNLDDSTKKNTGGYTNVTQSYVITVFDVNTQCIARDTLTVYYEAVEAEMALSRDTLCIHESLTGTVLKEDSTYTYAWLSGDGGSGGNVTSWEYAYGNTGTYDFMLIVRNEHCADTATVPVAVKDFSLELTSSALLADRGSAVTLQTHADEPYSITAWKPLSLFGDQAAFSQTVSVDTTRTYQVFGMSAYGCADSAEILVAVNTQAFIPSSFTPNGDGRNDYFRVVSWGDPLTFTQFRILDRWGKEIWSGSGAGAVTGWDGTYNGTPANMGVYYYYVEYQSAQGVKEVKQGDLTLIR